MIKQIRFLKGECGWVNFPDGAIKPRVVNGNEVINVSSCQTEGFRDGTRTSPGEKDHSSAFIIMQQPRQFCGDPEVCEVRRSI